MIRSVNHDQNPMYQTCVTIFISNTTAKPDGQNDFNTPRACDSSLCYGFESPRTLWCSTLDSVASFS